LLLNFDLCFLSLTDSKPCSMCWQLIRSTTRWGTDWVWMFVCKCVM